MKLFAKNEIIELNRDIEVGDTKYRLGQKFVVSKVTSTKTHVVMLNDKGEMVPEKSLVGTLRSIAGVMVSTNTAFILKNVDHSTLKKGNFYTFKKEYKESDLIIPVGTRAVLVKGGAKPVLGTFNRLKNRKSHDWLTLSVSPEFFEVFMTPAEPVVCELTKDWSIKGLKERTGQETRNFELNLCYKNKVVGGADNDGHGGCHRIHVDGNEWKALNQKAFDIVKPLDNSKDERFIMKLHDMEEILVDFFLENNGGLMNLNDYLVRYMDERYSF